MTLLTTLGLRALPNQPTINHAPTYLTIHFILAYLVLAPRHLKQIYGLDHNASPRTDLSLYGSAAVKSGKISQKMLDMMKRNEAAQANAIENLVLFVGALSMATLAGVENESINKGALIYTVGRVVYAGFYIGTGDQWLSLGRSVAWWVGNGACLWLLNKAGRKMSVV